MSADVSPLASEARPWSKAIPAGPWDDIVIGSGMGGMTCAAILAELGRRVLVLEQHYTPGGFTHMFKRPGYRWDVGVHAVGEVTEHSLTGRLLHRLTGGKLEWASLGPVYDTFELPGGFRIDFPDHPAQFRENLLDAFPDERDAIDGYLHRVKSVAKAMKSYYLARLAPEGSLGRVADAMLGRQARRYLTERTKDVVEELTDDPRLRALFTAQWGYYGSTPSRSSFAIQALVVRHFAYGGFYPVGGASRIAETLLGTVAKAGGWTAVRADVAEILLEGGRAVGVRLVDGREIRSRRVISACGVASTVGRLLPASATRRWGPEVRALRPASAHVCLYLGFEGDIAAAGAGSANQWFYETWDMEADAWPVAPGRELPDAPVLYTSFPSLKDPAHDPGPRQRHTGEVVTFVPWDVFTPYLDRPWRRRGEDYEAFKARMSERLLAQLFRHRPELERHLAMAELSTPASTHQFARPVQGSIYGLEPTPERFQNPWLRPRSPIPNLIFAGSEVSTVGVIGAMMGGVLAAVSAEPIGAMRLIRPLWR
ncbi:MAG: phytoene desaturase family protein [Sandaracinaceae bacterium]